jgi:glucose/arabinose dehydrogenase
VAQYVDINDSTWGVLVDSRGRERGFQSFAFHPQFAERGTPGFGKFYTWTDSRRLDVTPDFRPAGGTATHHTVLHEWTARDPMARTYDGTAPREMLRVEQPFTNHNGGMIGFNPVARPGTPEFGLLYVGIADGGSGGDPLNMAQNLGSALGKIIRIDPIGRNSSNGKYGIPQSNPFAAGRRAGALPEIYAYGVRNPQRFGWDPANGNMFFVDIGQNIVEKVSLVPAGANLGWNAWEGSFRYIGRGGVDTAGMRSDPSVTYPVVEYAHGDPLLQGQAAVSGVYVIRDNAIPPLRNRVIFSDFPSGEFFYFDADNLPRGGNRDFHRVLLRASGGEPATVLQIIRQKQSSEGKPVSSRADLRFGMGADGRVFLLNKADGIIRVLVP